jgi:hypothetical protein
MIIEPLGSVTRDGVGLSAEGSCLASVLRRSAWVWLVGVG